MQIFEIRVVSFNYFKSNNLILVHLLRTFTHEFSYMRGQLEKQCLRRRSDLCSGHTEVT